MLLSTPAYFTFLIAVFFAYWLVSRFRFAGLAVIVFANYFFYARWDLVYLALIPAASTCDFFIGHALGRDSQAASSGACWSRSASCSTSDSSRR